MRDRIIIHRLYPKWLARLCRLGGDHSGVALMEFAIVCPILLLLFLGGTQYADAISCGRKVTITARAVADLTSQYAVLSASQADTILSASAQVMSPYTTGNALVRVSSIKINSAGAGVVQWSRALNGTKLATNSTVTVPSTLAVAGTYYLYSEVTYPWTPQFTLAGLISSKSLTDQFLLLPRVSTSVSCNDC